MAIEDILIEIWCVCACAFVRVCVCAGVCVCVCAGVDVETVDMGWTSGMVS